MTTNEPADEPDPDIPDRPASGEPGDGAADRSPEPGSELEPRSESAAVDGADVEPVTPMSVRRSLLGLGHDLGKQADVFHATELRVLCALRAGALMELEGLPTESSPVVRDLIVREVVAEYAVTTNRDPRSVAALMERAYTYVTRFPATLAALGDGRVSRLHAEAIRLEGEPIEDDDRRAVYEELALDVAPTKAAGQFRSFVKRIAEQFRTESLADRHARECLNRRVWWTPDEDGMSWLGVYGPTLQLAAIYDTLTSGAKAQKAANAKAVTALRTSGDRAGADAATDPRSRDEMRFDLFAELLLTTDLNRAGSPDGAVGGIRANIDVLVNADALTGTSRASANEAVDSGTTGTAAAPAPGTATGTGATTGDVGASGGAHSGTDNGGTGTGTDTDTDTDMTVTAPEPHEVAVLNGRHPIPVPAARELLSTCTSFLRILTDPTTGMPTSVDRRHPTKQMKDYLRVRDRMCRFPGCTARPADCEDDHTIPWEDGGKTSIGNLGELCPGHHTLKHHSRFDLEQLEPGVFAWTTPTGQRVTTRPDDFDLRRQIQQAIEDRISDDEPWRRRRPDPDRGESSVRFRDDAWDPADADKPTSINLARVVHERRGGCPPGCTSCTPLDQIPRPPTSRDPDDEPPF